MSNTEGTAEEISGVLGQHVHTPDGTKRTVAIEAQTELAFKMVVIWLSWTYEARDIIDRRCTEAASSQYDIVRVG